MLKFKEPIKLKTGLQLSGAAESFFERLNGNYEMMSARTAPKDLLFLLTQPPEIPEDLFGATQFNISNSITDARRVTMEVVNNVVNRILLSTQPSFTYQDQVYITTMLNKLGVTDVNHFMQEVRRIREEQHDQFELTKLYRQEINRTIKSGEKPQQQPSITIINAEKGEEKAVAPSTRYYLHQEIYDRLETSDIYQEINDIHRNSFEQNTTIAQNELRLAEQLRISRDLQLNQVKQTYLSTTSPTMHHHINHYEQGDVLPPPATEDEVIAQAAQAALLSTVERVITQSIDRKTLWREPWLQIKNSLHQTAENTISRFESYHSDPTIRNYYSDSFNELHRTIISEEKAALQQLRATNIEMQQLEHITINQPQQEDAFLPRTAHEQPQIIRERTHELTNKLHRLTELQHEIQTKQEQAPAANQEIVIRESAELITRELKEIDRQNRERLERMQLVRAQMQQPPKMTPPDPRRTMQDALRALDSPEQVLKEIAERQEQQKARPQPSAIEQILAHTDSTTRQLLETVIKYEQNPQAAIESGLVQLNNLGALNAESAARQAAPVVTEHPKPQIPPEQFEQAARQTSRALEHFTEQPIRPAAQQRQPGRWDETPRVFRRENTNSIEELVEKLEEQRTQSLQQQTIHEDIVQQSTVQTEIHDQTSKVIAHTTEDITEIVNRQMARQMNTITDQVYRQMERKLQTERNRRGRF